MSEDQVFGRSREAASPSDGQGAVAPSSAIPTISVPVTYANAEQVAKFARGRAGAARWLTGDDLATAVEGWFPKLAGKQVVTPGRPLTGYATRAEALKAAARFRAGCRAWLSQNTAPIPSDGEAHAQPERPNQDSQVKS